MAMMWRPDPVSDRQMRLPCSVLLHREAGKRGYSCDPKRSSIGHDAGYYAEVNQVSADTARLNVALGTGPTPLAAALDGYRQQVPINGDPLWAVVLLECEVALLAEAAAA